MAYGNLRFLYNNLIPDYSALTLSTQATGRYSDSSKVGSGVATLAITGSFAAAFDLNYELEIDSIAGGTEVGQSTFKWRTSDTAAGAWEETGVVTRTTPAYALSADGLGGGLSVAHTGATGSDFIIADSWQWDARATYGTERPLDRNRMTTWRTTADTSETIIINLGSAQAVTAFILQDHNLSAGATCNLQGNASDSWGSPSYDSGNITIQEPLYLYLSETYQYWRILITDAANPDGYVEAANIFLGTYLELEQVNAWWGSSQVDGYTIQANTSEPGVFRRYAYGSQKKLSLDFGNVVSNNDIDSFIALQAALVNTTTHRVLPLWVHLFQDEADTLTLMEWADLGEWEHTYFQYLLNSGVTMNLEEVIKV